MMKLEMTERRAKRVLDDRKSMVKLPKTVSVHTRGDNEVILTFSEGKRKEAYSFSLSKDMSESILEALGIALETMDQQLQITETRH